MSINNAGHEVSPDHSDDFIPEPINNFLEQNFELAEFRGRKEVYVMLMTNKKIQKNEFLKHLQESYRLIDFWRFLILGVIEELNSTPGASKIELRKAVCRDCIIR